MPKLPGQAYVQRRIIWVESCAECPYRGGDAIVPVCNGKNESRKRFGDGKELPNFYPRVPDWCPLDGADACG